jgi:hypothetical protein
VFASHGDPAVSRAVMMPILPVKSAREASRFYSISSFALQ